MQHKYIFKWTELLNLVWTYIREYRAFFIRENLDSQVEECKVLPALLFHLPNSPFIGSTLARVRFSKLF